MSVKDTVECNIEGTEKCAVECTVKCDVCDVCEHYWNNVAPQREAQQVWISHKVYEIGNIVKDHEPSSFSTKNMIWHAVKVEQDPWTTEDCHRLYPELKGTPYNNLITCKGNNWHDSVCMFLNM